MGVTHLTVEEQRISKGWTVEVVLSATPLYGGAAFSAPTTPLIILACYLAIVV